MKRRHFFQFAGSTLAAMGLSQQDFFTRANRYGSALAQSTPRKLAMLVGINNYPAYSSLRGCLTDVDLQYELLVNRFGFNPADIVKVSDTEALKPTRETILQVFREHLIDQARPGDVVVFHYSGHGARVVDPNPVYAGSDLNGTLVPNDPLPEGATGIVPDIMGRTLFLLTRSLQTDNVTMVLDSCHSGGGLRGNTVVRAVRELVSETRQAMPAEFELQERLLKDTGLSFDDFQTARLAGLARGLGIGSAQFDEYALDVPYSGFHAGSFSYLLTRYLWQLPGSVPAKTVRENLVRSTRAVAAAKNYSQVPLFQIAPDGNGLTQPIYFTAPARGSAEAVITNVSGDQIEFWLGGVSSQSLAVVGTQAGFTALNDRREPVGEIEQVSRSGLVGIGRLVSGDSSAISPGSLMRETVVGLLANPQLKMGVDASLGEAIADAIELLPETLTSGQTGQSQIVAALVDPEVTFDYVLGRMTQAYRDRLKAENFAPIPPIGSILLFTPALEPVPTSSGRVDETVAAAISRLQPRLKALLVNKVLKALTATASEIAVSGEIFADTEPSRSVPIGQAALNSNAITGLASFKAGENVRIRVENNDPEESIYLSCLAIDAAGNMTVIYPNDWNAPEDAALIAPNSELVLPRPEDDVEYPVNLDEGEESGFVEVLTLTSTGSLRNALRALQEIAVSRGTRQGNVPLNESQGSDWLGAVLGDINEISRSRASLTVTSIDSQRVAVDSGAIAVFSTVIEVVKE